MHYTFLTKVSQSIIELHVTKHMRLYLHWEENMHVPNNKVRLI